MAYISNATMQHGEHSKSGRDIAMATRAGRCRAVRARACRRRPPPKASPVICARPASEPMTDDASSGIMMIFWLGDFGERFQRLHVVVGDEVVDRLHVALGDGLGHELRWPWLRPRPQRSRASASRKAASLRPSASSTTACFSPSALQDRGLPQAFDFEDLRALLALGLHLAGHAVDEVARRRDVLDLDARDLDAPGLGRLRRRTCSSRALIWSRLDSSSSRSMEPMTVRMLVIVRLMIDVLELVDLVGGLGGVEHLEEVDAVDAHHGVVAGDDVLARDVDHLLLHVHAWWPTRSIDRDEDVQAGLQRARVAAEVLDRVVVCPAARS